MQGELLFMIVKEGCMTSTESPIGESFGETDMRRSVVFCL